MSSSKFLLAVPFFMLDFWCLLTPRSVKNTHPGILCGKLGIKKYIRNGNNRMEHLALTFGMCVYKCVLGGGMVRGLRGWHG